MLSRVILLTVLLNLFLFTHINANAQQSGVITGTITDAENGHSLIGASIIVNNNKEQATSDVDGKFNINGLTNGTYTIKVSYVGYETKQISDVQVNAGEPTILNVTLNAAKNNTLLNVTVQTTARRENLSSLLITRKNSAVVSDAISAEQIRRSPDKNTSDVLKRVSGTTIQENKFVIVRGMNDRYNEAMLNNAILPSSEPDRKTFAFDIFPSDVVDNITIIKSATPDLPGSFSGGLIEINTKDVPDKNFLAVKAGVGYNSITTGKNYYDYKGGSTDWLGIDDGTRALPSKFPDKDIFTNISDPKKIIHFAQMFPNDWAYYYKNAAPVNPVFQVSGGFNAKIAANKTYPKLGGIFGISYTSNFKFSEYRRLDYLDNGDTSYNYKDSSCTRTILASALGNFSLKLDPNNKLFFNNIYSISSSNVTVLRFGPAPVSGYTDIKANSFFFASNRLINTQIGGDHFFPAIKLRIKWNGYYTNLYRNEPDYRRNVYLTFDSNSPYFALITAGTSVSTVSGGIRYYGNVKDEAKGANVDLSLPFTMLKHQQTFKFGAAYYYDTRSRDIRFFTTAYDPQYFNQKYLFYAQDSIFSQANYNKHGFTLIEDNNPSNHYDGSIKNVAGYLMLDNKFTDKLRFVWGVRLENYHQILNTVNNIGDPLNSDTVYHDWLPSANLIYSVLSNANLRASFSRTVARPLYRELANTFFYDFLTNTTYSGNPDLTEAHINNYEIRWEHYFRSAQYYSISGFYKEFKNPIEQFLPISGGDSRTVNYANTPKATNIGVEFEGRKNFDFISRKLEGLIAFANVSLIKSKIDLKGTGDTAASRPLQGQSPYIINAGLQFNNTKNTFGISVLYNEIGSRIFLVGSSQDQAIWEKPHPSLDIKLNKSFLKRGFAEFTFADVLHQNDIQYWDLNNNKKYDAGTDRLIVQQSFGFNMSLALGYRF
ncbi:MAG: TonB-dependent receptor domain-containing protein [Chitinophagaceae bacterium]